MKTEYNDVTSGLKFVFKKLIIRILQISISLKTYMVVNFSAYKINKCA